MKNPNMKRRDFVKVALGGLALGQQVWGQQTLGGSTGIPKRPLGKTGEQVSIIGLYRKRQGQGLSHLHDA